jgi:hypothetical protein
LLNTPLKEQLMELLISSVSVQQAIEGFKPKIFQVSVSSKNNIDCFAIDFKINVEIPFNESLNFSEIESLALAQVDLVLRK